MLQTDQTLTSSAELYDIQMLESLNIPLGKELFCTELDLGLEEIDSMNACARVLGLILEDDSLSEIHIRAINVEDKQILGFIAHNSQLGNSESRKEIAFYIKRGCNNDLSELKDFALTRRYHDGRNQTDCLYKGIVVNPLESAYLLLLHKILLSHGILRDNPEFAAQMQIKEKELKEIQDKEIQIEENDDLEQQQLEMDFENFEDYVISNGSIHIEKEDKIITAEKHGDKFIINCIQDGTVLFEFLHESSLNDEGERTTNSYTIKFHGHELWDPKSMIKISKYSKEIFGNSLELIRERIIQ